MFSLSLESFVKHELKGVLKYIGVEICTHPPGAPPQTVTENRHESVTDRDRKSV
jgi:hypothetical protein